MKNGIIQLEIYEEIILREAIITMLENYSYKRYYVK